MNLSRQTVALASAGALILMLAACGKKADDQTVGQKLDAAVTQTGQAAASARSDAREAVQQTRDAVKETGEKMADKLSDATITAEVNAGLARDADLSAIKINVDTRDGKVTLTGPAPTAMARDRATAIARGVKGVNAVDNQLVVRAG